MLINIAQDLLPQFIRQLALVQQGNDWHLPANMGNGTITTQTFPDNVQCLHFEFRLAEPINLRSFNPPDSQYFLLNINLSKSSVEKKVNQQTLNLQKHLPSGILFYPRDIEVASTSPPQTPFDIVLVRFPKEWLLAYSTSLYELVLASSKTVIYEDLEPELLQQLLQVLRSASNLQAHAALLQFLARFFAKLEHRKSQPVQDNLHPKDIKGLFLAAAHLRDPNASTIPTIPALARIAQMGETKFKRTFKQVFGRPPRQYHQQIKMAYAQECLRKPENSISDVAYQLGYAHPSKFTRAFKKYFGYLPSDI